MFQTLLCSVLARHLRLRAALKAAPALLALTLALAALGLQPASAQQQGGLRGRLIIGAGPVNGPNYVVGGAICAIINRDSARHGFECWVMPNNGIRDNILGMQNGRISAFLIQSDWQSYIYNGDIPGLRLTTLRHLFSLQSRAIMLVARAGADIQDMTDLKDRRISLGPEDSGQRVLSEAILRVAGYAQSSFSGTFGLKGQEIYKAICIDESIDAAFLPANIPSAAIQELILGCGATLVPISGPTFDRLIRDNPYLSEVTIPSTAYEGLENDINTLAFSSTIVSTDSLPDEAAYTITEAVFDNLDAFRELHPLLGRLDPDKMAGVGATAPRHVGAERYFDQAGITR
jgi:TRAP transporter TAXI family solute receptor